MGLSQVYWPFDISDWGGEMWNCSMGELIPGTSVFDFFLVFQFCIFPHIYVPSSCWHLIFFPLFSAWVVLLIKLLKLCHPLLPLRRIKINAFLTSCFVPFRWTKHGRTYWALELLCSAEDVWITSSASSDLL